MRTCGIIAFALLLTHCANDPSPRDNASVIPNDAPESGDNTAFIPNDAAESGDDARTVPDGCEGAACLERWACKEALWWYDYDISGFACSGDTLMACHDVFTPVPGDCCAKQCECEPVRTCSAGCEQNLIGDACCIEDDSCVHGLGTQEPCCDGQGVCQNPDSLRLDVDIDPLLREAVQDNCMAGEICLTTWFADHPQTSDLVGPWPACVPTSTPGTTEEGRCVPECSQTAMNWIRLLETNSDYQDFPPIAQDDCALGLVCIPCAYTIRCKERETYVCKLQPLE